MFTEVSFFYVNKHFCLLIGIMAASEVTLDTDSEDELPAGWEERLTDDGKVYYAW